MQLSALTPWLASVAPALPPAISPAISPATSGDPPQQAAPQDDVARYRATVPDLETPRAVAVGPDGRIWVAESGADRVRAFAPDGTELYLVAPDGAVDLLPTGRLRTA